VAGNRSIFIRELKFFGLVFALSMAMFSFFRLLFFFVYNADFDSVPAGEIFSGFIHGLRFDAAISAMGLAAVLILSCLPFVNRFKLFRWLWIAAAHIVIIVFFLLLLADLQYFQHARKRLGYEAFAYLDSTFLPVIKTAVIEKPHYIILTLLFIAAFIGLARLVIKRLKLTRYEPAPLKTYLLAYLVLVPLLVVLGRGGLQRVPLRTADSFISSYNAVNILTINSPHLAFRSLGKSHRVNLMDSEKARRISLELLDIKDENVVDPAYPIFVKTTRQTDTIVPYNVVLILMESWTGKFVGPNGDRLGVTPVFNRLAETGLFFNRFFATGFRSTSGLFSTLTGIPDQVGVPVMRRAELLDNFGSLSNLLKQYNYRNIFVHGGLLDFDNLENMLVHEKFDHVIGKNELKGCGGPERTWGYDDEYAFIRAHEEFDRLGGKPFFGMIFTVTNHAPYKLPDERFAVFDERDHPEYAFLNAYHYSDWALGEFFKRAEKADYFKNTIFIITGDHTHHGGKLNMFENQHLPLLLYAPGIVEPGIKATVGSQVDILPTVAELLNLPYRAALGRDLLSLGENDGFALWISGQGIGWAENDYIAFMGLDNKRPMVYDFINRDFSDNLALRETVLADSIRMKADALYQLSADLLRDNKIIPAEYISF